MAFSQCCQNPPELSSACGGGSVVESFGGLKSYVTGSLDSKLAVLLISDVFGFEAPNLRKLADKVAAVGYFVVVPDFFYGDPFVMGKDFTDKGFKDAKSVDAALKDKGITAIGAVGFCWGAKVVAELAKTYEIKAGVMLHPSLVSMEDIKEVKVPLAVLGAEKDDISPPELLEKFEKILATKNKVDGYVKIYSGVEHGWTVKYNVNDEAAVRKAEEAHYAMMEWFMKYM